jgi:hypothetical protein
MSSVVHKQISIQVWVDVDEGIADFVKLLNTIEGVRTHASCQGTIGEGGPHPYRPQVMCSWTPEAFARLSKDFDVTVNASGVGWGYVHPRDPSAAACTADETAAR